MKRITRLTLAAFALTLVPVGAASAADTYDVDPVHSEVGFQIRHLVSKVRGHFAAFTGSVQVDSARPEASSVTFTIKAASIDTGNADRDKHLKSTDFFEVEKFPEITFKSSKVVPAGPNKYDVTGAFTMHGVTKQLTLSVSYLGAGADPWGNQRAGFELQTVLSRKDYGIVWNKTLEAGGALLGDEVNISINIEAIKQKAQLKPAA